MANFKAPTTNNPDDWWKHYNQKAQGVMEQIEEREPFSFDVNSDPLYEQLKDQYIQQGRLSMMDTMGQAAAMTGGYGNSYAQTAGQQAYNQQISQLNEVVPELYGMAYDKYTQEEQDLYNKYQLYAGARDAAGKDKESTAVPKEYSASQEDIAAVQKKIASCENEDQLNDVYESLLKEGWGEDWVAIWVKAKDREFTVNANQIDTLQGDYVAPRTNGSNGRYTY